MTCDFHIDTADIEQLNENLTDEKLCLHLDCIFIFRAIFYHINHLAG